MAITNTVDRIRLESFAKNGTLGSQAASPELSANQIKFDTAITTNNGNLEASPTFDDRHVVIREGTGTEERNLITSVDVDGVTCTCINDWDTAPASGDAYIVQYIPEDVATVPGCDYETDSGQWVMTKRLIIGVTTITAGGLGLSRGKILRLDDRGPTLTALQVNTLGWLMIGINKELSTGESRAERGGQLIFTNDASNETVMDIDGHAFMYEFAMHSAFAHSGVIGLKVTHDAGATVKWSRFQGSGMDVPYRKLVRLIRERWDAGTVNDNVFTVAQIKAMAFYGGWCHSEIDQSVREAIVGKADTDLVRILVEEA